MAPANPIGLAFNGSIGLPISSTEISIRDDAGAELPVNGVGEICVFGPQVMRGYWNRPDETEKVMFGDWLRTGDIGRMDAQGLRLHRRPQEGHDSGVRLQRLSERSRERRRGEHPGVLEAAAVAQPDESSGEVVALFVVKKDPSLTAEALIALLPHELTGYKVPKHVYFRSELAEDQRRQDSAPRAAR